eukprot:147159-Lingulodinium_polyedra.AAC.1
MLAASTNWQEAWKQMQTTCDTLCRATVANNIGKQGKTRKTRNLCKLGTGNAYANLRVVANAL